MRARVALLAVVGSVLLPAAAGADGVEITQHLVDDDGGPRLVANQRPVGGQPVSWRICTPECGTVVAGGEVFAPRPAGPGTVYEASTTVAGVTTTARSRPWGGPVASAAPPTLTGEPRIGRVVTPVRGTWTGGWGDETGAVGVRACPTAAGTGCREVVPRGAVPSNEPTTIDPAYAGWYLGAYEVRFGAGAVFPAIAVLPPPFGTVSSRPAPSPSSTIAVGPLVGPVPAARPGTAPRVGGTPAVGRTVTPRPGTWPDAPQGGRILSSLRACPTPRDSARCELLHARDGAGGRPRPGRPVRVAPNLLGWYLGTVDEHLPAGDVPGLPAPATPPTVPPPGPAVVHGPLSTEAVRLGFTPRASVPRRATVRGRGLRLATIRCAGRCVARVAVRAGGRTTQRRVVVPAGRPTVVSVPRRAVGTARTLRLTIRFDDHPAVARRTVRVR